MCACVCSGGHLKERVQLMIKYALGCVCVCVLWESVCETEFFFFFFFRPVWFCFPPPHLPGLICENLKSALNKNSSINSITHNSFCSSFVRQTAGFSCNAVFPFLSSTEGCAAKHVRLLQTSNPESDTSQL